MTGDWEIRTGDGSVRVELPEGFAGSLDATTGDGRVAVEGFDGSAAQASRGHDEGRSSLRQSLGAGGKLLRLRTGSGGISVRKL